MRALVMDTSALMAILFGEQEQEHIQAALDSSDEVLMGAPTRLEADVVALRKQGPVLRQRVADLCDVLGIVVVEFTDRHRRAAADAYQRFGKGRHPASLNLGDACAYATAHLAALPLLFVGDDFAQTDIEAAR